MLSTYLILVLFHVAFIMNIYTIFQCEPSFNNDTIIVYGAINHLGIISCFISMCSGPKSFFNQIYAKRLNMQKISNWVGWILSVEDAIQHKLFTIKLTMTTTIASFFQNLNFQSGEKCSIFLSTFLKNFCRDSFCSDFEQIYWKNTLKGT